jgi:hypothetical protein
MRHRREEGQILVIVAAGLLVLMAVGALVVDLGFSWMLRRQEQNAADPGAIAAARWLVTDSGDPRDPRPEAGIEACFYARENGFFPDATTSDLSSTGCVPANDPRGTRLTVNWPPASGPYAAQTGKVQVVISSTHPSFFAHIFGQDFATVTTGAVAANEAGNSNSNSLVALDPTTDCDTGMIQGTGGGTPKVTIIPAKDSGGNAVDGGYVYVNSACNAASSAGLAACVGGSGSLKVSGTNSSLTAPKIYTVGRCVLNGSGATIQTSEGNLVNQGQVPIGDPLAGVPRPRLSDFKNGTCPNGTTALPTATSGCALTKAACPTVSGGVNVCHITPGVYYGGWSVGSKVKVQLEPGMYILAGGGISLSSTDSSIESVTDSFGTEPRVTIFSTDGPGCPAKPAQCQAAVKFTANQSFRAKATNLTSCQQILSKSPPGPNTCPWRGILLWQDGEGSHPDAAVELGGQANTVLAGTIYAPLAEVKISGGSATTGCAGTTTQSCLAIQIISWSWKIVGNAIVEMPYDPKELYQLDERGLVH